MDRGELAAAVQRELTVFARRVRGVPQRMTQELPFVAYSMLSSIDDVDGCRSVDLNRLGDRRFSVGCSSSRLCAVAVSLCTAATVVAETKARRITGEARRGRRAGMSGES